MAKAFRRIDSAASQFGLFAGESQLLKVLTSASKARSLRFLDTSKGGSFVSIDEVGRGCLAGPVVVCATAWQSLEDVASTAPWIEYLKDSKKLSQKKREELYGSMLTHLGKAWHCEDLPSLRKTTDSMLEVSLTTAFQTPAKVQKFTHSDVRRLIGEKPPSEGIQIFSMTCAAIGSATPQEIDLYGLSHSLNIAAQRALDRLELHKSPDFLFFDGNRPLKLSSSWSQLTQCLVTQGDDCLKSISASSVLAKVVRDHWMDKLSSSFPEFGFSDNRGYGTEAHRKALAQVGPTRVHRHSFLKNICPVMLP